MSPGELVRVTRIGCGLTQERLARRVGTHQSAVSRLEADEISPSIETLELWLSAMGKRLALRGDSPERDYDPLHRRTMARRSPAERLALGISWNRLAGRLSAAGREARGKD